MAIKEYKPTGNARRNMSALDKSGRFDRPIAVEIRDASAFTAAEANHQNFHQRNPAYYARYRVGCGRDARIRELWGDEATH